MDDSFLVSLPTSSQTPTVSKQHYLRSGGLGLGEIIGRFYFFSLLLTILAPLIVEKQVSLFDSGINSCKIPPIGFFVFSLSSNARSKMSGENPSGSIIDVILLIEELSESLSTSKLPSSR